jgi:hypothetical protein
MVHILAPISAGELVDKITILRIKLEKLGDTAQLDNVRHELDQLTQVRIRSIVGTDGCAPLENQLLQINRELWQVEDELREREHLRDFGAGFVDLARRVYTLNDQRSALKKKINEMTGSSIVEEKSYGTRR